jgi:acetyl-CoA synthetase
MLNQTGSLTYAALRKDFKWRVPSRFNIGTACADQQPPTRLALIETGQGGTREYTFGDLTALSNRLANALNGLGVRPGDRVAILLPQRVETGVCHLAAYKLGAVAVPMSVLFGPQALRYRLDDADVRVVFTDGEHLDAVDEVVSDLRDVKIVVVGDGVVAPHEPFERLLACGSPAFKAIETEADAPALLIYTSGTTGPPKGALHGHRALLGHLPGFQLSHNFFPQANDRFWTPADWAWIGGLMDALLPSWYFGSPIVAASRGRFDPEWALGLIEKFHVRNVFLPPTALKMIRRVRIGAVRPRLRSIMCGGEPLGEEMFESARETFNVVVNEIYGQTEANYVVGNSSEIWPVRPGSMGKPYPGHSVLVLRKDGQPASIGEQGEFAVATPDPVVFLQYWNQPDATVEKLTPDGRYVLTGDLGRTDEDGYLWFDARQDDVITSAGYRIGPGEIEDCLVSHPAVAMAAVIGVPDGVRGEVVKAFVQLVAADAASPSLKAEIAEHVRRRLATYEYPRYIDFVDSLPLTTTGKIRRSELRRQEAQRAAEAPALANSPLAEPRPA